MSATVSTLLQVTAALQCDKQTSLPSNSEQRDFLSHLETATESSQFQSSKKDRGNDPADDLDTVAAGSSQDGETASEQFESDTNTATTEATGQDDRDELDADTDDVLELSEAIVSYLTYQGENPSSAVIEVSQESGVVVTELDSLAENSTSGTATTGPIGQCDAIVNPAGTADSTGTTPELLPGGSSEPVEEASELVSTEVLTNGPEVLTEEGASELVGESNAESADQQGVQDLDGTQKLVESAADGNKQHVKSPPTAVGSQDESLDETAQEAEVDESKEKERDTKADGESKFTESLEDQPSDLAWQASETDTTAEGKELRTPAQEDANVDVKVHPLQERSLSENSGPANTPTHDSAPVPTGDRVRFVQRVSRAFHAAKPGSNEIQLKLSPPELGTLRMSITVEQGVVSAKVETETAAARNILLDNLPALRERLAEQQIRVEKFDVDLGRDGQHNDQQSQFTSQDRQSATGSSNAPHRHDRETLASATSTNSRAQVPAQVVTDSSLDVSI